MLASSTDNSCVKAGAWVGVVLQIGSNSRKFWALKISCYTVLFFTCCLVLCTTEQLNHKTINDQHPTQPIETIHCVQYSFDDNQTIQF